VLTVTKRFKFDAAHRLPNHGGKCHQLHGHTYHLEVTVTGSLDSDDGSVTKGMIIDFHDLGVLVKTNFINKYDHGYLNDHFDNPTAENMVLYIGQKLHSLLPSGVTLVSCKLWETEDCFATYIPTPRKMQYGDKDTGHHTAQPVLSEV